MTDKEILLEIIKHKGSCDSMHIDNCPSCIYYYNEDYCAKMEYVDEESYAVTLKDYIDAYGEDEELFEVLL